MFANVTIQRHDPHSVHAQAMFDALWDEIQQRYDFTGPNGIRPDHFVGERAALWLAFDGDVPVGSIGLTPLSAHAGELDAVYVAPGYRGVGVAQQLLHVLEDAARQQSLTVLRLRAGEPQPEALRFYEKMGFQRIPCFGQWTQDPTAVCYEKSLTPAPTV
jgi:GNAT superfamily N-acetyltransferase